MSVAAISPSAVGISGQNSIFGTGEKSSADSAKTSEASETARQFESLLVSMMLKQMRQSGSEDGMFPGDKSDTYGGMFDMFMGDHIASGDGIGVAQMLESQSAMMNHRDEPADQERLRAAATAVYSKGIDGL